MDINKVITSLNREDLGEYFLFKASEFALNREFGKSYEYFKESLDILTCDCSGSNWLFKNPASNKNIFSDVIDHRSAKFEYYFVKAYMLSHTKIIEDLYIALDAINRYIEIKKDGYGFYVKGNILCNLDKHEEAYLCLLEARTYSSNTNIEYRIGRIKEKYLNKDGTKELFKSFFGNISSTCCGREFCEHSLKRNKILKDESSTNKLMVSFNKNINNGSDFIGLEFCIDLCTYLGSKRMGSNKSSLEAGEALTTIIEFIKILEKNRNTFIREEALGFDNNSCHEGDFDKYGGYNGFDDDSIDNAFEGDPMNTWNVE
jgi:tetratricopeptide (TPR) repeat protein